MADESSADKLAYWTFILTMVCTVAYAGSVFAFVLNANAELPNAEPAEAQHD